MSRESNPRWRPARVVNNRAVAQGSMWLTLEAADELPADYEPGHVLSLGLREDDGHYLRHAYTVSRSDVCRRRFEHLYRVIPEGRMTPRLAELKPGADMFFYGPFHTPIRQEIDASAEGIILMATGTGIGPIFGYAERALSEGETRPMTLYGGFHDQAHFCLVDDLDGLARRYGSFRWRFTVSNPSAPWIGLKGRITDRIPPLLGRDILETHHFHLVGNGAMVHLMRQALYASGLPGKRVSVETYFNHHAIPSDAEIDAVLAQFRNARRPL